MGFRSTSTARVGVVAAVCIALACASSQFSAPTAYAEQLNGSGPVALEVVDEGASNDPAVIADAASDFNGTPASVANLADAASATEKVALTRQGSTLVAETTDGAEISVNRDGTAMVSGLTGNAVAAFTAITWTATNCLADVVTLVSLSAVVFAKIVTKVSSLVAKSARIAALIQKIGGVPKFFTALKAAAKGLLEGKVGKYLSATQLTALIGLSDLALNTIADIAGIGSCYSLIRAAL